MISRIFLALVLCSHAVAGVASNDLSDYKVPEGLLLKIGAPMPEVDLTNADGTVRNTRTLKGQPTVVNFFTSHCAPCIREIPALNAFRKEHPEIDLISITPDGQKSTRSVIENHKLTWPMLIAPEAVLDGWGVLAFPTFLLVDRNGIVVAATYGNRLGGEDGTVTSAGLAKWVARTLPGT